MNTENQYTSLEAVAFEPVFELLEFCLDEVFNSRVPLLLDELIKVTNHFIELANKTEPLLFAGEFFTPYQKVTKKRMNNPIQDQPNYDYLLGTLDCIEVVLGESTVYVSVDWFNEEEKEIMKQLRELVREYELTRQLVEIFENRGFNIERFDLFVKIKPNLKPLFIHYRDKIQIPPTSFVENPLNKELPLPKSGSYRKHQQTYNTYYTGSNAPLMAQGTGRNAKWIRRF